MASTSTSLSAALTATEARFGAGRAACLLLEEGGGKAREEKVSVFFSFSVSSFGRRRESAPRLSARRSIASLFFFLKRSAPCSSEQSSSRQSTAPESGVRHRAVFPQRQRPQKHRRRRPTARHSAARRQSRPSVDCLERGFFLLLLLRSDHPVDDSWAPMLSGFPSENRSHIVQDVLSLARRQGQGIPLRYRRVEER